MDFKKLVRAYDVKMSCDCPLRLWEQYRHQDDICYPSINAFLSLPNELPIEDQLDLFDMRNATDLVQIKAIVFSFIRDFPVGYFAACGCFIFDNLPSEREGS